MHGWIFWVLILKNGLLWAYNNINMGIHNMVTLPEEVVDLFMV